MNAKKAVQLGIGLAVTAVALYFSFENVKLQDLLDAFRQANWLYALPMMAITMASFYYRCYRWQLFLQPKYDIPARRLFGPLMIGFAFNNVLPLRAGEVARPLALLKQERVPFPTGMSTILLERVVDMITLLVLFAAMPLFMKIDPAISKVYGSGDYQITVNADWINGAIRMVSIGALIGVTGAITFLIPPVRRLYFAILDFLPWIPAGIKLKLRTLLETFAQGFDAIKSPRVIALTAFHSLVVWFSVAFSFQVMSWGFPGAEMTFAQSITFLVVTCVVISIPSSPGYWGVYEFGGMVALVLMGVVENTAAGEGKALAFTFLVHFLQWLPITAYGLIAASTLSLSPSALPAEEPSAPPAQPQEQP